MKAIIQDRYGPPDILELRDMDAPVVNADQVLARVHAAGLHAGDCFSVRGAPFPVRKLPGCSNLIELPRSQGLRSACRPPRAQPP